MTATITEKRSDREREIREAIALHTAQTLEYAKLAYGLSQPTLATTNPEGDDQ